MSSEESVLTVSASPHIKSGETVQKIMWNVNLALAPAAIFGMIWFGLPAVINIVVSIAAAVLTEYVIEKIRKVRVTVRDGSAFITGLLLAMCLPPTLPFYMTAFGAVIAVGVAKMTFGGLGYNIFNPAHIGRAALMVSWPALMTSWASRLPSPDAVTSATVLNVAKHEGYDAVISLFGSHTALYKALLLGTRNGSIGETSAILLLLGGVYLIARGYIKWQVPAVMIGTVGLLTWAFGGLMPSGSGGQLTGGMIFGGGGLFTGDPLFGMLSGGLIIGAFFMATDMVTIPITLKGQIIFAAGCGVITTLIRFVGGYPEGVCYSILLMNCLTPLIDRVTKPRIYGTGRKSYV
ncbi:electron transport complex protein RnfD [Sporobacter termitidis DSM 10068]|uniref:Ion-translocating oxidoreductase complex subunit D n=1 Tax=Sporobacter termitidis DSM 10068 TaxID=1123282 RepID=A0A1M5UIL9_9FIRM|nr:RnfABCDGE type electron transport complex subunit D [Sporobacter termitidis]SHH62760.1 electron transport complex protein RnfD [Sporobacter termitidis DSM 10068]